jgi:hippurate hydrolase
MRELRRAFHRRPELAYEEVETARTIMAEFDRLGIPYEYGGTGGGIIARLTGPTPGPRIALRAEMDALPCSEDTGLPFASAIPGRMHACGHDAHMAIVLGTAARLAVDPPSGSVVFVFQPAEERGNGARVMVDAGALEGVDAIFAGHVTTQYRVGEIMVADGTITAHSDRFDIAVHGESGHGARPHEAIDTVVVTGFLITAIQSLVSRHVNPVSPSVVTIGSVHAGTAANIIAGHAALEGIIRTTRPETRREIIDGLQRIARSLGELYRARIEVTLGESCPAVINTAREATVAAAAARDIVSDRGIVRQDHPSMGAEDFSYFLQETPGCYVRFGASATGEYIPLHHPRFDVDEGVLAIGAGFFERAVRRAARGDLR